jgi:hypothetical protein
MQGITCVKNEIHNNLAQLRLTSRHSDSGVSLSLKHAFKALFDSLSESKVDSLLHIDVRKCLSPFLLIITSKTSTLEQTLLGMEISFDFVLTPLVSMVVMFVWLISIAICSQILAVRPHQS